MPSISRSEITVAEYLVLRLKALGVDHLFGVPGDFVLGFLNQILTSELTYIGTCNELNAAYAADGYARIRGVGAFVTTYGVGELSAVNGVAGAFAEKVPVVVITGSPATVHFRNKPLLHHTLGDYQIPLRIYEKITAASCQLDSALQAPAEIDRVLSVCLAQQQPVYISLPADIAMQKCPRPDDFRFPQIVPSDPEVLAEAIQEAIGMISHASKTVVIGDVELIRFQLQAEFAALLEKTGFPFVTMMLGKTVLSEHHPQFMGLFEGDRSRAQIVEQIDSSDCILQFGALMTDFNTGGFTTHLDDNKTIRANIRTVRIKHHYYENVFLGDFIWGLTQKLSKIKPAETAIPSAVLTCTHRPSETYSPQPQAALTVKRFFDRMSHFLADDAIVIAETGVSLFSAAEMLMPEGAQFIGQTFYGSIGYSVGATLGAAMAAPDRQVVLFVGDGSFQVTGQEISTMIRNRLKPLVFLLNNDGYTIERVIVDRPYNDIQPWNYHKLVEVFGGGIGIDVHTEAELEAALAQATLCNEFMLIEIHTERFDCPDSLRIAGKAMAKTNQLI